MASNYLLQVAYTSEAWAHLIANPHDRIDAVRPVIESSAVRFCMAGTLSAITIS